MKPLHRASNMPPPDFSRQITVPPPSLMRNKPPQADTTNLKCPNCHNTNVYKSPISGKVICESCLIPEQTSHPSNTPSTSKPSTSQNVKPKRTLLKCSARDCRETFWHDEPHFQDMIIQDVGPTKGAAVLCEFCYDTNSAVLEHMENGHSMNAFQVRLKPNKHNIIQGWAGRCSACGSGHPVLVPGYACSGCNYKVPIDHYIHYDCGRKLQRHVQNQPNERGTVDCCRCQKLISEGFACKKCPEFTLCNECYKYTNKLFNNRYFVEVP